MISSLPSNLAPLLEEIIRLHYPKMSEILESPQDVCLTPEQIFNLQQSLGTELCETGLRGDDEPNRRGLQLEELIDWLGKEREKNRY